MPLSHVVRVVAVLMIMVLTASTLIAACFTPSLTELTPIAAGHHVTEFAIGDVNNDGQSDLVTVSFDSSEIKVRFGNGDGTFGDAATYAASSAQRITLGDLNNDNFLDIVVSSEPAQTAQCVSFGSCASYSVLLNNGDGTFAAAVTTPVPYAASITSLHIADFDHDGKRDLLVAAPPLNTLDPALHVLLGDGTGALPTRRSWFVDGTIRDAVPAKLNGPGAEPDVIAIVGPGSSSTFTRVIVYPSQGGTFPAMSASRDVIATNDESHLAIADYSGDGNLDIGVTFRHPVNNAWGAGLMTANGDTSLGGFSYYSVISSPLTGVAVADVDEDGDLDMMTAAGDTWEAFLPDGEAFGISPNSAFRYSSFTPPTIAKRVIADDFNHDGRTDFFFLDAVRDDVVPLVNSCPRYSKVIVTSSLNPSTPGAIVTFTISVQPKPNAPVPTGTVTLLEGTTTLGSATLNSSGVASITISNLPLGNHLLQASYAGDGGFAPQTSASYTQTVAQAPFGHPLNVTATGNAAAAQITIRWTTTSDVVSNDVLRKSNGAWIAIANVTGEMYNDSNVVNTAAYVYAVRSHSTGGQTSDVSNSDMATTAVLALPGDLMIRANHVLSTRSLISSVRFAAGLPVFAFTDDSLAGQSVKAVHVTDLRSSLNEARNSLGFPALTFASPAVTPGATPIHLVDVLEIRNSFN